MCHSRHIWFTSIIRIYRTITCRILDTIILCSNATTGEQRDPHLPNTPPCPRCPGLDFVDNSVLFVNIFCLLVRAVSSALDLRSTHITPNKQRVYTIICVKPGIRRAPIPAVWMRSNTDGWHVHVAHVLLWRCFFSCPQNFVSRTSGTTRSAEPPPQKKKNAKICVQYRPGS